MCHLSACRDSEGWRRRRPAALCGGALLPFTGFQRRRLPPPTWSLWCGLDPGPGLFAKVKLSSQVNVRKNQGIRWFIHTPKTETRVCSPTHTCRGLLHFCILDCQYFQFCSDACSGHINIYCKQDTYCSVSPSGDLDASTALILQLYRAEWKHTRWHQAQTFTMSLLTGRGEYSYFLQSESEFCCTDCVCSPLDSVRKRRNISQL